MRLPGRSSELLLALVVGSSLLAASCRKKAWGTRFAIAGAVRRPGAPHAVRPLGAATAASTFVRPGDELLLRVSIPRAGYLAVAAIGGRTGTETALYYPKAPNAARIAAGPAVDLSEIVADGRVGQELVYAFFCDEPVKTQDVLAQLGRSPGASNYMAPAGGIDLPCQVDVFGFLKCDADECPQEPDAAAEPEVATDGAWRPR